MHSFIQRLGIDPQSSGLSDGRKFFDSQSDQSTIDSVSPVDGVQIASVSIANLDDYNRLVDKAREASIYWRSVPAPKRGELVYHLGQRLREIKDDLGALVSYEMGKSLAEGRGEVQEMIDICDFAVGLSRQLHGLTMHSERPHHRMYEQWHPLGVVGIISAFNFPVAVWSWNAMIACVCGNATIWKPSEKTPLTAIACFKMITQLMNELDIPPGVMNLIVADVDPVGEAMIADRRMDLISATGSVRMGKRVGEVVGGRLGKMILELGGNNAVILTEQANLALAVPALVFGAVGTAGQRCTTTRRLIVHSSIYDKVKEAMVKAYEGLKIGTPLEEGYHCGPLIDQDAVASMQDALAQAKDQGGEILTGGEVLSGRGFESGCYVKPALVEARPDMPIVSEETFAPIAYLLRYEGSVEEAIAIQNNVTQGLSSAIFTDRLQEAEAFLSHSGSDCGIANVNIGTSGAEIGGAFGGEKDTGGGRESGSDAWKGYMRRQTNTINYGKDLPLAQGIKFDL